MTPTYTTLLVERLERVLRVYPLDPDVYEIITEAADELAKLEKDAQRHLLRVRRPLLEEEGTA